MSAPLDNQRIRHPVDRIPAADPQPHVVVFARRQVLVEQTHLVEQRPTDHDCRRADQAQLQRRNKYHPGWFAMPFAGIDAHTVADPGLFGLAGHRIRVLLKKSDLAAEFGRQPQVIGIQKGDQFPRSRSDPGVAGRTHAPVFLSQQADPVAVGSQNGVGGIGGPVVHHDQLGIRILLCQYRIDGLADDPAPVVGRNNNADQRRCVANRCRHQCPSFISCVESGPASSPAALPTPAPRSPDPGQTEKR